MPPIPIHRDAPIHPAAEKPSGVTQQTANPPPTRTTPAHVPATTTADSSNPPPPQPGARPAPPTAGAAANSNATSSLAAPQPGPTATHVTTETRLGGPPPQFTMPPPSDSQLAGRSTITSTTASKPGPTTLDLGPVASPYQAEHSQGATSSQERTSGEQRRSLEHPPGYVQAPNNITYSGEGQQQGGSGDGSVGDAAWNLLTKAGEALQKGEEAAWRAVRNK